MIGPKMYYLTVPLIDKPKEDISTNNSTAAEQHIIMSLLGFLLGLLLQCSSLAVFWMLQRKFTDELAFEIYAIWSYVTTLLATILIATLGSMLSESDTEWIQMIEVIGVMSSMIGGAVGVAFASIALDVNMNFYRLVLFVFCHCTVCVGVVKLSERWAKDHPVDVDVDDNATSLV
jgi:hypothetical protein